MSSFSFLSTAILFSLLGYSLCYVTMSAQKQTGVVPPHDSTQNSKEAAGHGDGSLV